MAYMKLIAMFFLSSILVLGCKKDEKATTPPAIASMETGIYSGKYVERDGAINTLYQFKVNVAKLNDSTYTITQIDAGNLPVIKMQDVLTVSSGANTRKKFRIFPQEDNAGNNFIGDARISNGYDAQWYALESSFSFGIVFDGDPNKYIHFNGIKE